MCIGKGRRGKGTHCPLDAIVGMEGIYPKLSGLKFKNISKNLWAQTFQSLEARILHSLHSSTTVPAWNSILSSGREEGNVMAIPFG